MKKSFPTRQLLVLIAIVLIALPAAFTTNAQGPVKLRYTLWIAADSAQVAVLKGIAEEYKKVKPNVEIAFDTIPFNDYQSVVTLQLAGNNPPDAGWIVEGSAPSWIASGILADLSPALKADKDYDLADFSDKAMRLWVADGKVYGVPFSNSPFVIIFNRDLFEKAGVDTPDKLIANKQWTWEKVAEIAKTIKEKTGTYGFQSNDAGLYKGNFWATIIPIMRAYGGDSWDAKNTCTFNSDKSIQALSLIHKMIFTDKGLVPPGEEIDFYAGNAGMTIGQLSRVARLAEAKFKWDIAPMPDGPAGYQPAIGQAAMVVFNNSKNRDVAIDFVRFATTKDSISKLVKFFPPARKSVLESEAFATTNAQVKPEQMKTIVATAIREGTVLTAHSQFPKIDLAVRPILDKLWVANADVKAVANDLCKAITPLLGR